MVPFGRSACIGVYPLLIGVGFILRFAFCRSPADRARHGGDRPAFRAQERRSCPIHPTSSVANASAMKVVMAMSESKSSAGSYVVNSAAMSRSPCIEALFRRPAGFLHRGRHRWNR